MSFTSYAFFIFFICVLGVYWLVKKQKWQNLILLVACYTFYGWISPWLSVMLGTSTLLDFALARGMRTKPTHTRIFMTLSLILNLGVLAFFKYYNFFSNDLVKAVSFLGIQSDFFLIRILLPAGLSFYTLKKLGYIIDVSRGTLKPTHSLVDFALYVAFFPQIVAGPIERPQKFLPQIETQRPWKADYFYAAWPLLVMGFFKKIVIADTIKTIVDRVFALSEPNVVLVIAATLGFSLQSLADFSGYTDISRGLASLLGFQTSENFNSPYLALTPTEFWNRWHITLSTWLRDYIFFPVRRALMRQKRTGWVTQFIPPLITMLASGVWHGATINFLLWGFLHGLWIILYQFLGLHGQWKPTGWIKRSLAWLAMFMFLVFSWLIFRAPSIHWVLGVLSTNPLQATTEDWAVALIAFAMMAVYCAPLLIKLFLDRYVTDQQLAHNIYYALATIAILIYINSATPDFIYFQF